MPRHQRDLGKRKIQDAVEQEHAKDDNKMSDDGMGGLDGLLSSSVDIVSVPILDAAFDAYVVISCCCMNISLNWME